MGGERHAPRLVDLLPVLRSRGVADGVPDHDDGIHCRALRVTGGDRGGPCENDDEGRDRRNCEGAVVSVC